MEVTVEAQRMATHLLCYEESASLDEFYVPGWFIRVY